MSSITFTATNFTDVLLFLHTNGISSSYNGASWIIHNINNGNTTAAVLATLTVDTYGYVTVG